MSKKRKKFYKFGQLKKQLITALVGIFVVVGLFGVYACLGSVTFLADHIDHGVRSHQGAVSPTSVCLLGMKQNDCGMNFSDHLNHWQNTFLFSLVVDSLSGVLAAFALLVFFNIISKIRIQEIIYSAPYERYRQYCQRHPDSILYNIFSEFFSSGILHSKIYA